MPNIVNLVTNTTVHAKIKRIKNKIPRITNLASTNALTAVENKISNVSLVKKTGYNTKLSGTENKITTDHDHDKYFASHKFNELTSQNFTARLAQAN